MILCPNCLHEEMVGAIFCTECGSQLVFSDGVPTSTIHPPADTGPMPPQKGRSSAPPPTIEQAGTGIALNLLEAGKVIALGERKEATLGRVSQGQPIIPDIDLTPYKAYETGVSRMHASIKLKEGLLTITDLGSVNGTRINGKKISAHIPYPIKNGDILTLGRFKIQVLLSKQ